YVVLKMFCAHEGAADGVTSEQVSIVLGKNYVISFQERPGEIFTPVRERIKTAKTKIRKLGADYLAHALIDAVVDNYFSVLENLGERVETVEEALVSDPRPNALRELQVLKREMIFLRKSVWPLRETISSLERTESALIDEATRIYFKDIYDHTVTIIDTIETFRDMLSGMLDIYLSSVSNRMNEVMKVLTVIATIFMPLTFIVGVYGMNFKFMPELEWTYGYLMVWAIIIVVSVTMVIYFLRKKWL
ncbi:MAG: magnesium/cobalt transporter CorA, partial [Smithellaceae bacterium]|nr:magnesium/cobalt transporter CorA [Smithellaceae bacterium]